jgi:hypothetical protein
MTTAKHIRLPLPTAYTRCLGHGPCCIADACSRHVSIRHDPFGSSCKVLDRVCHVGEHNAFLPLSDKVLMP